MTRDGISNFTFAMSFRWSSLAERLSHTNTWLREIALARRTFVKVIYLAIEIYELRRNYFLSLAKLLFKVTLNTNAYGTHFYSFPKFRHI